MASRILTAEQARRPECRYTNAAFGVCLAIAAGSTAATANADNSRLNNSVIADVYAVQHQAGCTNDVKPDQQLRLAANGTPLMCSTIAISMPTSAPTDPHRKTAPTRWLRGAVAETVAINPPWPSAASN